MAYYTETVQSKDLVSALIQKITAVQPGETSPWWTDESSLSSDGVFTSIGSSGNERIVLVLRESNIGHDFTVGYAKDYTPGAVNTAGDFENLRTEQIEYFDGTEDPTVEVTYDLSVTPDRIIIHVQGDKLVSGWQNSVVFLGMPIKYDKDDTRCVGIALSEDANGNSNFIMLEDSVGRVHQNYNWYYVNSPDNPSWGNNFFVETFHFGLGGEGLRGELDGIYGTHPNGIVDGDEVDVGGIKFKVIQRRSYGQNNFPRPTLLMRKS